MEGATFISNSDIQNQTTDVSVLFKAQRENTNAVAQTTAAQRIVKLKKLLNTVLKYRTAINDALYADFKKPAAEVDLVEIYPLKTEIDLACKQLKKWMQPESVSIPIALLGTKSYIQYEAKGVCLIISPWNFPLSLTFGPLVSAIAAGNTAILKPSEMTPHISALMGKIISEIFEPNEVVVIEGDASVATALLKLPFNHIFFTGAPSIGKVVMRAAAENLASVTLELGGKSPTIVDETANIDRAAKRIMMTKFTNSGQICLAPDYVYVHESKKEEFIAASKKWIPYFFGNTAQKMNDGDFTHMVNARHFARVKKYLDDAVERGAHILLGGNVDAKTNFIEPTLLDNTNENMLLMQEEIFGPLLPIRTFSHLDEVINHINANEKPLATYIFSSSKANQDTILKRTSSGGVTINDAAIHYYNGNLPFGGVNNSGIGKAHGHFGFKDFSNLKAVTVQKSPFSGIEMMYPPYTPRIKKLIDLTIKWL